MLDGEAYFAYDCSELQNPPASLEGKFEDLRSLAGLLPPEEGALLAYARGMCHWHQSSRFCPRCGEATRILDAGHQKKCINESCGFSQFPRTDPAVIMLVEDGDRVVLGRQSRWPAGMHSIWPVLSNPEKAWKTQWYVKSGKKPGSKLKARIPVIPTLAVSCFPDAWIPMQRTS